MPTVVIHMERRRRIALIMPEIIDPSDYELIQGVHAQAKQFGLGVVILTGIYNYRVQHRVQRNRSPTTE